MHRLPTREGRAGTVSPRSVWDSDREEEMDKEQNTSVVLNSVAYSETKVEEKGGGWSSIMLWTSVVAFQHGRCDQILKVSLLI